MERYKMTKAPRDLKYFFPKFPVLANERVLLREVTHYDLASIVDISFYDGIPAKSEAEAAVMLDKIQADYQRGESVHWGICLAGTHEIIGTCTFYGGYPDNVAEIGYVLKESYHGQGVMTEALSLVIDFAFKSMKLSGIIAQTAKENLKSIRVLKILGFSEVPSNNTYLKFLRQPPKM
jgi:[ribosomal protein S5]-alanine N-acetyltransferase